MHPWNDARRPYQGLANLVLLQLSCLLRLLLPGEPLPRYWDLLVTTFLCWFKSLLKVEERSLAKDFLFLHLWHSAPATILHLQTQGDGERHGPLHQDALLWLETLPSNGGRCCEGTATVCRRVRWILLGKLRKCKGLLTAAEETVSPFAVARKQIPMYDVSYCMLHRVTVTWCYLLLVTLYETFSLGAFPFQLCFWEHFITSHQMCDHSASGFALDDRSVFRWVRSGCDECRLRHQWRLPRSCWVLQEWAGQLK